MEGSRIFVKKGAKLTIKNSFIEGSMGGCNIVKWRGIELEPNVSQASNSVKLYAEIDIDSSTIKRASCAIKSGASYNFNYRKDFGGNIKINHSQIDGCDTTILQFIDVNGTNYLNINYCKFYGEDKQFALSNKTVTKNHIIIGTSNNLNFILDKAKILLYPDSIYTIKIQNTLFDGCYNSVITTDNLCNWGEVGATGIFSVCNPIKGMKLENNIFANFIGKNVSRVIECLKARAENLRNAAKRISVLRLDFEFGKRVKFPFQRFGRNSQKIRVFRKNANPFGDFRLLGVIADSVNFFIKRHIIRF